MNRPLMPTRLPPPRPDKENHMYEFNMCKCGSMILNCLFCKECYEKYLRTLDYEKYVFYLLHTLPKDILHEIVELTTIDRFPTSLFRQPVYLKTLAGDEREYPMYIMRYLDINNIMGYISSYQYIPPSTLEPDDDFIYRLNHEFNRVMRLKYNK